MEDILGNPVYATAQGLLLYARQNYNGAYSGQGEASRREPQPIAVTEQPGMMERMKSWFQGNF
jgi:cell division protein FtsA